MTTKNIHQSALPAAQIDIDEFNRLGFPTPLRGNSYLGLRVRLRSRQKYVNINDLLDKQQKRTNNKINKQNK